MLLSLAFVSNTLAENTATLEQRVAQLESVAKSASPISSGDNTWLLVSSALVLMMTAPGLILFYGGLVRSKNVLSTMMHSMILMAVVSMLWMVFGYSMANGNSPVNAMVRVRVSPGAAVIRTLLPTWTTTLFFWVS